MKTKDKFETIEVERPEAAITRIVMNRPEARNAQNLQMTYDLNAAFDAAVQDDAVKVIILAGSGPHFSAGHDLRPGGKPIICRNLEWWWIRPGCILPCASRL